MATPSADALKRPETPHARDPFALELAKNALVTLADEMALSVTRPGRLLDGKEARDFSTALFLADGDLIAQGTCLPEGPPPEGPPGPPPPAGRLASPLPARLTAGPLD